MLVKIFEYIRRPSPARDGTRLITCQLGGGSRVSRIVHFLPVSALQKLLAVNVAGFNIQVIEIAVVAIQFYHAGNPEESSLLFIEVLAVIVVAFRDEQAHVRDHAIIVRVPRDGDLRAETAAHVLRVFPPQRRRHRRPFGGSQSTRAGIVALASGCRDGGAGRKREG